MPNNTLQNVIIQFCSFPERDHWVVALKDRIKRIYKREPWIAASIDEQDRNNLNREAKVTIVQDTFLSAM